MKRPETAIAAIVVACLRREGWHVREEYIIEGLAERPDLIAARGCEVHVIEAKATGVTFHGLHQSRRWQDYCSRTWLAVPEPSFNQDSSEGQTIIACFKALGVGLYVVGSSSIRPVVGAALNPSPRCAGVILEGPARQVVHAAGSPGKPRNPELDAVRARLVELVVEHERQRIAAYETALLGEGFRPRDVLSAIREARDGKLAGVSCPRGQIRRFYSAERPAEVA